DFLFDRILGRRGALIMPVALAVHLVGLSMGGRLATLVALEHPDLLLSLTVLEPPLDDLWMISRIHTPRVTGGGKGLRRFARQREPGTRYEPPGCFTNWLTIRVLGVWTRNLNRSAGWSWTTRGPSHSLFPRGHRPSRAPLLVA